MGASLHRDRDRCIHIIEIIKSLGIFTVGELLFSLEQKRNKVARHSDGELLVYSAAPETLK